MESSPYLDKGFNMDMAKESETLGNLLRITIFFLKKRRRGFQYKLQCGNGNSRAIPL
jgi:hypothetical protein